MASQAVIARRVIAPYRAGDTLTLIHQTDAGVVAGDVHVETCIPLGDGRWRLELHRQLAGASEVDVIVRADGYDDHGLIVPAVTA